jgi:hypothetical protein
MEFTVAAMVTETRRPQYSKSFLGGRAGSHTSMWIEHSEVRLSDQVILRLLAVAVVSPAKADQSCRTTTT